MKWYENLKISVKLILGFFVVAIVAVIVGIVGLVSIFNINEGSSTLYNNNTRAIAFSGDAYANF